MRRIGVAVVALACACNLITGASDLESSADDPCGGGDCLPDGGRGDGSADVPDGALVSDVQKDGDDLTPGGFLDGTFGTSGVVKTGLLGTAYAVAVDSIGRAYVLGPSGPHLALVRFTAGGKVDTSFGTMGRLSIPMGAASGGSLPNIAVPDATAGIAIDTLDRVVVCGTSQENFSDPNPDGGAPLARYERYLYVARIKDGVFDASFAQGGKYRPSPAVNGEGGRACAIAANDGVVVVGSGPASSFTVWRLTESGNADPAFGAGGRATIAVPAATSALAGAMNGGSILAAGGSNGDFAIAELSELGAAAPGFGDDAGVAIAKAGPGTDLARAVAALSDGRIVVAGAKSTSGVRSPVFAIARLAANGALDGTFGAAGFASFDFDMGGTWKDVDEELRGVAIDSRARVVVAGEVMEKPMTGPPLYRTVLARMTPDGALDPLFGTGGKVSFTDQTTGHLRASSLARARNGALLVAGNVDGSAEIFVARIIP